MNDYPMAIVPPTRFRSDAAFCETPLGSMRWFDAAELEVSANETDPARTTATPHYLEGCQEDNEESPRCGLAWVGRVVPVGGRTDHDLGSSITHHPTPPTTHTTATALLHYPPDTLEDNPACEAFQQPSTQDLLADLAEQVAADEADEADEPETWDGGELWVSLPAPALKLGLTDHALYVVALLSARKRLDQHGWRHLKRKHLEDRLGETRVNGKQVERAVLVLGSRKRPDEGELIAKGIVERYASYSSFGGNEYAQQYRLKDQTWLEAPREGVTLCLRPSGRAKLIVEVARPDEAPIPPYLRARYDTHSLEVEGAVRHILADAGHHAERVNKENRTKRKKTEVVAPSMDLDPNDYAACVAAIDAMGLIKNPELAGRRGRPPKGLCRDLRERWLHALEHVFANYVHKQPARHELSRAHGRLFSPFVGLWSELRRYVRLGGEPLVELDIKNAQPLLIAARMVEEGFGEVEDVRLFAELCQNGLIYEYAHNLLHGHELDAPVASDDRARMKQGFYSGWMFCEADTMDKSDFGKAMTIAFPTVDTWVRDQKVEDYASFACNCQRFESTLLVDKLAVVFEREGLDPLTVHDACYVRRSQAERACDLLKSEVLASLPVRPIVNPKLVE